MGKNFGGVASIRVDFNARAINLGLLSENRDFLSLRSASRPARFRSRNHDDWNEMEFSRVRYCNCINVQRTPFSALVEAGE